MKIETIENETKSENTPKCYGCGVVVFPEDDNCCDKCLEASYEE
jgi:hypothetical protein